MLKIVNLVLEWNKLLKMSLTQKFTYPQISLATDFKNFFGIFFSQHF